MTGWWLSHPSEKCDFVSWKNIWKNVPNHQPDILIGDQITT
jgi:hypothetical protein